VLTQIADTDGEVRVETRADVLGCTLVTVLFDLLSGFELHHWGLSGPDPGLVAGGRRTTLPVGNSAATRTA
jgi:hypothetical protein